MNFTDSLVNIGVGSQQHILVHCSFRKIRKSFPLLSINSLISSLKSLVTSKGSIIMPSFTYCFKQVKKRQEKFDRKNSPSKVGAVSELFRLSEGTVRTSSPTHSFSIWGNITKELSYRNNPQSPLGEKSVLDLMNKKSGSFILMLGTDFSSLSFGHYIEIKIQVPWYDYSPWEHLGVEKKGISINSEKILKEIPGCSKSFVNFENYLLQKGKIEKHDLNGLSAYFIPVKLVVDEGKKYFKKFPENLLCKKGTCKACDSRRSKFYPDNL